MSKRIAAKKQVEEEAAASIKFPIKWTKHDLLSFGDAGTKPSDKILSFDMVHRKINKYKK